MIWCGLKIEENCHELVNQFHGHYHQKTLSSWKIKCVFRNVKSCINASWGLKGLTMSRLFGILSSVVAILRCFQGKLNYPDYTFITQQLIHLTWLLGSRWVGRWIIDISSRRIHVACRMGLWSLNVIKMMRLVHSHWVPWWIIPVWNLH